MSNSEVLSQKTTVSPVINYNSCKLHCCVPIYTANRNSFPDSESSTIPDLQLTDDLHSSCCEHNIFWSQSPYSESSFSTGINYTDTVAKTYINHQQHCYYQQLHFNSYMKEDINRQHSPNPQQMVVKGIKRRNTANKKERRRTQSINAAFQELRERIPNVPADTKLSKIKTLRLATSYISYLMAVLETNEPAIGFRADLVATGLHSTRRSNSHCARKQKDNTSVKCSYLDERTSQDSYLGNSRIENEINASQTFGRKSKGRTGWPQHVWALELKHEQNIQ